MREPLDTSGLGMHVVDGVLMVQAPDDFDDEALRKLRASVLAKVHSLSVRGVLIDVSTIRMIDSVGFGLLADTARTVALLGAKTVFVGFSPGVVSALIDLDVACEGILAAVDLADGMAQVRPRPAVSPDEPEEEPETGQESGDEDGLSDPDAAAPDPAPAAEARESQDDHEPAD